MRMGWDLAVLGAIIGGLVGTVFGRLLGIVWAPLGTSVIRVGTTPGTVWTVNLGIMGVQAGAWVNLNVLGLIGMVTGWMWVIRQGRKR
jgi:hypothetical protein